MIETAQMPSEQMLETLADAPDQSRYYLEGGAVLRPQGQPDVLDLASASVKAFPGCRWPPDGRRVPLAGRSADYRPGRRLVLALSALSSGTTTACCSPRMAGSAEDSRCSPSVKGRPWRSEPVYVLELDEAAHNAW